MGVIGSEDSEKDQLVPGVPATAKLALQSICQRILCIYFDLVDCRLVS